MTDSAAGDVDGGADWRRAVIANIDEVFLQPEIDRRGGREAVGDVRKAVIFLEPGAGVRVLLNDEAEVVGDVRVTRPIQAGEEVTSADIAEIVSVRPLDIPEDAGWVAYVRLTDGNVIAAFDFRRNRGKATRLLSLAEQYMTASRESETAGRTGPSIDAAHTAAELAVTAMMYSTNDDPIGAGRSGHSKRSKWLKDDSSLGNTPTESSRALGRLGGLRPAARYGSRPIDLSPAELDGLLSEVEALMEHARLRVGPPLPSYSVGDEPGPSADGEI